MNAPVQPISATRAQPGSRTLEGGINVDLGPSVAKVLGMRPAQPAPRDAIRHTTATADGVVPPPGAAPTPPTAAVGPRKPVPMVEIAELSDERVATIGRMSGRAFIAVQQQYGTIGEIDMAKIGLDLMIDLAKHCVEIFPEPTDLAFRARLNEGNILGAINILHQSGQGETGVDVGEFPVGDMLEIVNKVAKVNFPKARSLRGQR